MQSAEETKKAKQKPAKGSKLIESESEDSDDLGGWNN